MAELLILAILVMFLNVMDSTTTYIAFKQYPDKELKAEANPAMRWLMRKNKWLAEIIKQSAVLGMVLLVFIADDTMSMRLMAIALSIVVLNNLYIVVIRAIRKYKVISPLKALVKTCHIPQKIEYVVAVLMIIGLVYLVNTVVW